MSTGAHRIASGPRLPKTAYLPTHSAVKARLKTTVKPGVNRGMLRPDGLMAGRVSAKRDAPSCPVHGAGRLYGHRVSRGTEQVRRCFSSNIINIVDVIAGPSGPVKGSRAEVTLYHRAGVSVGCNPVIFGAPSGYNAVVTMEVIPAIDIRNGKCVRLYQGDYSRETVYADDPVEVALRWEAEGAPRLHLVDLDGAACGRPVNKDAVTAIVRAVKVPVQVGGGIRTRETVKEMLALGAHRVVLGTVAVEDPSLVAGLCREYHEAIVVGIDARGGRVATRGWVEDTGVSVEELAVRMAGSGVKRVIYTDISRDGTLTWPDFATLGRLVERVRLAVIASGGVASLDHVRQLATLGVEGVIIGRALYTGDVKLKDALAAAGG